MKTADPKLNPYQSPSNKSSRAVDQGRLIIFRGSMTVAEFYDVHNAKKLLHSRVGQAMAWLFCAAVGLGAVAYAIYVFLFEGFDDFFVSTFVGLGLVFVVPIICYAERKRDRKKLDALKAQNSGVFSLVRGEIGASGILIATREQSLDYGWDTLCGYRSRGNAIVVYVSFPDDYVALAASWFAMEDDWETAKQAIETRLAPIGWSASRIAPCASRSSSPMWQAMSYFTQGKWEAAAKACEELLAFDPDNVHALRWRAKAIGATEADPSIVLSAVQTAIDHGAVDTLMIHMRAGLLVADRQFDLALADFDELVHRDPDEPDHLRGRGLVLLKLGEFERAINDCSAAIQRHPGDAIAYNNRGVARLELGLIDKAIKDFKKAISLEPSFPNPQQHLQRAYSLNAPLDPVCDEPTVANATEVS